MRAFRKGGPIRRPSRAGHPAAWAVGLAATALLVAACAAGPGTAGGSGGASASPSAPASSAASLPTRVFGDAELMALLDQVGQKRGVPHAAQDTQRLRIAFTANSAPAQTTVTVPAACQVFLEKSPSATAADKSVSFAMGSLADAGSTAPPSAAGGTGGPLSTVMITVRSAAREALAASQFASTDAAASSCATFDATSTDVSGTMTSSVRMLQAPQVGEKAFATLETSTPPRPGDYGGTRLTVLAGSVSVSLFRAVRSDADAPAALDSMAAITRDVIEQAAANAPTVTAPAPNSRTPEQLAALLKSIPGPGGSTPMVQAQRLSSPGSAPSQDRCTFDNAAYLSALAGSSMAQAQFAGAAKSFIEVTAISMADAIGQPYPFDTRAAALRDCPSITESMGMEGPKREWSSLQQLPAGPQGDAAYAVRYQLSDGTGEIHVLVGARRGSLTVEASDIAHSEGEVQTSAAALTALVDQAFAKAP